jgi:hypothetical protein
MSLTGEIITAFVAALGTIGTTVGLVAYLLRDLRSDIQGIRIEMGVETDGLRSEMGGLRSEMGGLRSELRAEIQELRTEVRSDIQKLRTEVRSDIQELRTEVRSDIQDVRSEIRQVLVELLHHVQTAHQPPPPQAA